MGRETEYYDLYEGKQLYLQCVTRTEINRMLNINRNSYSEYVYNGYLLEGRYTVRFAGQSESKANETMQDFEEKWEEAIRPFRRVIWCHDEGKKLRIMRHRA